MKIFKKKERRFEKKTIILIEVSVTIIIALALIGVKLLVAQNNAENTIVLKNQKVSSFDLTDFNIVYKNKKSVVSVTIANNTDNDLRIKKITITLYDSSNIKITELSTDFTNDNSELVLGTNQSNTIKADVNQDLTSVSKVEYTVE